MVVTVIMVGTTGDVPREITWTCEGSTVKTGENIPSTVSTGGLLSLQETLELSLRLRALPGMTVLNEREDEIPQNRKNAK